LPGRKGSEVAAMSDLSVRFRAAQWWLLPVAALVVLLGWETHWGAALSMQHAAEEAIAPTPVVALLLPEYAIDGGVAAHSDTVNRTLFNPTRRPAPLLAAEAAKAKMQRGLYALTGTTLAGDRSLAFLRELNGGKPRTVKQGETISGMLVAEVKSDRVKLTLGDESEELVLKVSTNPRPTPQPVAAVPQVPPGTQPQPATVAGQEAAQTLAERRRAARAAEAASQPARAAAAPAAGMVQQAAPVAGVAQQAPPAAAAAQQPDPAWAQVYQRYQERAQQR